MANAYLSPATPGRSAITAHFIAQGGTNWCRLHAGSQLPRGDRGPRDVVLMARDPSTNHRPLRMGRPAAAAVHARHAGAFLARLRLRSQPNHNSAPVTFIMEGVTPGAATSSTPPGPQPTNNGSTPLADKAPTQPHPNQATPPLTGTNVGIATAAATHHSVIGQVRRPGQRVSARRRRPDR
jgi:hypothetical protein